MVPYSLYYGASTGRQNDIGNYLGPRSKQVAQIHGRDHFSRLRLPLPDLVEAPSSAIAGFRGAGVQDLVTPSGDMQIRRGYWPGCS